VLQAGDARVEPALAQRLAARDLRQRACRGGDHPVGHHARLGQQRAQPQPGEDEHVVALADGVPPAVQHDVRERAAGRHQRAPLAPAQDLLRARLGVVGGIGQRHDDRVLAVTRHAADDALGERTGLAGDADQQRGAEALRHHLEIRAALGAETALLRDLLRPGHLGLVLVAEAAAHQQAAAVEHADRVRVAARLADRAGELAADAQSRRAGAQHHRALRGERGAAAAQRRQHAGETHRARALDVVVEGRQALAVTVQQARGIVLAEVLPLQQHAGEHLAHRRDELLEQRVVGLAAQAASRPAEVQLVLQQRGAVGADIEAHRQRVGRMDAAGRAVQRQLADGDRHAARALVADAEDRLVVGRDDELHPPAPGRGAQHLGDPPAVVRRDPHAARAAEHMAELARRQAHRRRVDDRHQRLELVDEHAVEQLLVAILQGRQLEVLVEGLAHPVERHVDAPLLLRHAVDPAGQQAVQAEQRALLRRERRALVDQRVAVEVHPAAADAQRRVAPRG
jgi:hypothetical protein